MELFKVHTIEHAAQLLEETVLPWHPETQCVSIGKSLGRVLASNVRGDSDVPHFSRSVVDGYAVKAQETVGAGDSSPVFFKVIGAVNMGAENSLHLVPGTAASVPTGGALPSGADGVVMVEYVEGCGVDTIAVYKSVSHGENVLGAGEDFKAGETLFPMGHRLRPQDIGVLAAAGILQVEVFKKVRVAVISTGDELVDPSVVPGPGQIRDINTYTIAALVEESGAETVYSRVVADDWDLLRAAVAEALDASDVLLLSGGSSVGPKDYTQRIIASFESGKILTHGLAIKPGKPTIAATLMGKPVFGLPGQPASAMVVYKTVVHPLLEKMASGSAVPERRVEGFAGVNMPSAPGRTTLQMVTLAEEDGRIIAMPVHGKSGMITLMSKAQGYIVIDAMKEGLTRGEAVKVVLF